MVPGPDFITLEEGCDGVWPGAISGHERVPKSELAWAAASGFRQPVEDADDVPMVVLRCVTVLLRRALGCLAR